MVGLSTVILSTKDDNYVGQTKRCGLFCIKTEEYLLCPSCEIFVWHKSCLEQICVDMSLKIPDWNSPKWECPLRMFEYTSNFNEIS